MKEYRVEVKIKNNLIFQKIKEKGFPSVSSFCREYKISENTMSKLTNLRKSAFDERGGLRSTVQKLCDALNCLPEEIFPEFQLENAVKSNKRTIEMEEAEVKHYLERQEMALLPDESINKEDRNNLLYEMLLTLTPKETQILGLRFGLQDGNPKSLEEIGKIFGVNRERIRQIECKAFRKMRHPSRAEELKEYL